MALARAALDQGNPALIDAMAHPQYVCCGAQWPQRSREQFRKAFAEHWQGDPDKIRFSATDGQREK